MSLVSTIPSVDQIRAYLSTACDGANVVPIVKECSSNPIHDTVNSFLKLRRGDHSIFWECSEEKDPTTVAFAVIATEPWKIVTCGTEDGQLKGDPINHIAKELSSIVVAPPFKLSPAILNGAALGYVGYDCVKYFETRVAKYVQEDALKLPESVMMFFNSFVFFDYIKKKVSIISLCILDPDHLETNYQSAVQRIQELEHRIKEGTIHNYYNSPPAPLSVAVSNAKEGGYQRYVSKLREYIIDGYIIQAVPSQRLERPTVIHPFNFFKQLRTINSSRYNFYLEFGDFQVMGASPELLVKVENGRVVTHPIAGTRKRGSTPEEDIALEKELLKDEKELAEHVMLVDLGRNDVNRVAIPETTNVDSLMLVERFSHVMHIVSQVSGTLRPECTRFDAFRSIFPAGTVSGAPKVQAMEIVASLEKEKRGVYAGAVGYFSFDGDLDTCIAIRTAVSKNGNIYFQAGGGIVYDSDPELENQETIHKMAALERALKVAEELNENNFQTGKNQNPEISPKPSEFIYLDRNPGNSIIPNSGNSIIPNSGNSIIPKSIFRTTSVGKKTTLLIDNYDSFTWNLYQYLTKIGENVIVYRNDQISVSECLEIAPDHLMISPGPGWPTDAGISNDLILAFSGKIPILGVCLGHECLTEIFGGEVIHCGEIKHGKTSKIIHDGNGIYRGLPAELEVIRYHSLAANIKKIPEEFSVSSRTENGVVMGIRHGRFKIEGVQFHPESIKTDFGIDMLRNFINLEGGVWD